MLQVRFWFTMVYLVESNPDFLATRRVSALCEAPL